MSTKDWVRNVSAQKSTDQPTLILSSSTRLYPEDLLFSTLYLKTLNAKCVKTEDTNCDEAQRFNSLDKFLKKFPDTPPTPGYVAINGNSLLEWVTSRHTVLQVGDAKTS